MQTNDLPIAVRMFQGSWFRRDDLVLELTPTEIDFIVATLGTNPKKWDGNCQPDVATMKAMLKAHPNVLDRIGTGLLKVCIPFPGSGPAVRLLLEQQIELDADPNEYNILHEAAHSGAADSVKVVFESGLADAACVSVEKPHTGWPSNLSLLYWAAWGGYPEFAKVCLAHGAAVHLELEIKGNGERGSTVLQESLAPSHWSVDNRRTIGKQQTADILISAGAHYDVFSACARNDLNRLRELIVQDHTLASTPDNFGSTPLHWAARVDGVDCVNELLRLGVELDVLNGSKRTAVQWAAEQNCAASIELLAKAGADLDTSDGKGRTPLHRATYEGQVAAIEALLGYGADVTLVNNKGKTAFEIARKNARHYRKMGI